MTGAPRLDDPTETMFPGPTNDQWFRRLLNVPLVFMVDDEAKKLTLDRPLPVTPYYSSCEDDLKELGGGQLLPPALDLMRWDTALSTAMPDLLSRWSEEAAVWLNISPDNTSLESPKVTHVLLEAPVLADVPTIRSGRWNLDVLGFDLADTVEAFRLRDEQSCGAQSLKNVFLEFSPLEVPAWDRSEESDDEILRAASLVRNENRYILRTFSQGISAENKGMRIMNPPAYYEFDGKGKFYICSPEQGCRVPAQGTVWHEEVFFTILTILRKLSPLASGDAIAPFVDIGNDGAARFGINVEHGATLRLVRVTSPEGRDWHFLRTVKNNRPFAPVRLHSPDIARPPVL